MDDRPKRVQTQTDRDLQSDSRRRRDAAAIKARLGEMNDYEVDDVTSPFELFERQPDDGARAIVQRAGCAGDEPATKLDVAKLVVALSKERSANKKRGDDYEAVLRSPRDVAARLEARIARSEKTLKMARRIAVGAIITLAGGVGTVATGILNRAEAHGGDSVRIQAVEKAIDRLDAELHEIRIQLGRRSELEITPPIDISKGQLQ